MLNNVCKLLNCKSAHLRRFIINIYMENMSLKEEKFSLLFLYSSHTPTTKRINLKALKTIFHLPHQFIYFQKINLNVFQLQFKLCRYRGIFMEDFCKVVLLICEWTFEELSFRRMFSTLSIDVNYYLTSPITSSTLSNATYAEKWNPAKYLILYLIFHATRSSFRIFGEGTFAIWYS